MQASVKINDLSCLSESNYSHSQTYTWCSRSEHFPEHHTLTAPQDSSEVQSHVKFMFRWREGDEVKPCARTSKEKQKPQHLLIRPKPGQVWYFSFPWTQSDTMCFRLFTSQDHQFPTLHSHLVLAPSCPPLAPTQQGFNSCPLKLLRLRLSWIPAGSTIMSNPLCLESNTRGGFIICKWLLPWRECFN